MKYDPTTYADLVSRLRQESPTPLVFGEKLFSLAYRLKFENGVGMTAEELSGGLIGSLHSSDSDDLRLRRLDTVLDSLTKYPLDHGDRVLLGALVAYGARYHQSLSDAAASALERVLAEFVAREATTEANGDVDDPDEPLAERALHPYTAGIPEAEYILETLRSRSHGR